MIDYPPQSANCNKYSFLLVANEVFVEHSCFLHQVATSGVHATIYENDYHISQNLSQTSTSDLRLISVSWIWLFRANFSGISLILHTTFHVTSLKPQNSFYFFQLVCFSQFYTVKDFSSQSLMQFSVVWHFRLFLFSEVFAKSINWFLAKNFALLELPAMHHFFGQRAK